MLVVEAVQDVHGDVMPPSPNSRVDGALTTPPSSTSGSNGVTSQTMSQHGVGAMHGATGVVRVALPMRALTRILSLSTERHLQFVDVTEQVTSCVAEAGIQDGFVVVFSPHTTAGIRINEHEPLLLEDMANLLNRIAPAGADYQHDDFTVRTANLTQNERVNGHSHCRSLLLGASESVPVVGGQLLLGRWQRIFLVELDGPLQRQFIVQVVGS